MKRLFLIITIVLTISSTAGAFLLPAFLYFGLPVAAVDLSIIAHVTVGSLLWWYNRPGGAKSVDSNGNVFSEGQVQWVDLKDGKLATYGASTKNRVGYSDLSALVKANPTKYPNLNNSMKGVPTTGDVVSWNNSKFKLGASSGQTYDSRNYDFYDGYNYYVNLGQSHPDNPNIFLHMGYWVSPTSDPVTNPSSVSAQQFSSNVSNSDNSLKSEFRGEIDDFINSNPNVVHYEDSSGNDAKSQIPFTAMTKGQIDAIKAGQAAVDAAQNAYNQYSTTKSPADYQKYLDARAAELAANSTAKPEESSDDVNKAVTSNPGRYDGVIDQPQKSSIKDLVNGFIASSPFHSIISGTNFSLSGSTSSITLTVRGKNYSIDFSRWQTQLELLGSLILTSVHLSAVWIVLGRRD